MSPSGTLAKRMVYFELIPMESLPEQSFPGYAMMATPVSSSVSIILHLILAWWLNPILFLHSRYAQDWKNTSDQSSLAVARLVGPYSFSTYILGVHRCRIVLCGNIIHLYDTPGFPVLNDPLYNNSAWGPQMGKKGEGVEDIKKVSKTASVRRNFCYYSTPWFFQNFIIILLLYLKHRTPYRTSWFFSTGNFLCRITWWQTQSST